MMIKNSNKSINLRGNPLLWTIEYWTHVLRPCADKESDYTFEKESVKVMRVKEFTFAPVFKNPRSSTNGWRTLEYCDPKMHVVATAMMHILRPHQTIYVTAWQVRFIERAVRREAIHWWKVFYHLVWINVSNRWRGGSINHMIPFLVNFYRGMRLLTKNEEKRFSKERKVLKLKSDENFEEKDDTQAKEILRGAARVPIRVKVVTVEKRSKRRSAKRQKCSHDRGVASTTDEDTREEVNLWTTEATSLGVENEDPLEKDVKPSGGEDCNIKSRS
ncbi:hypothetical protein AXG93_3349s1030 [Marchantia polymorpha subsp. ruderalis]|uniref:Uncharacterized protein n=1 Tax=Marchantia polymorpha subsp. ruderalis TaxID=1480154 RepID=A0A176WFD0_MARPO|nr:hypothetical protein AXG93_3349s1030 [Marchantia polymorpha subsp. ruderalis]